MHATIYLVYILSLYLYTPFFHLSVLPRVLAANCSDCYTSIFMNIFGNINESTSLPPHGTHWIGTAG